MAINVTIDCSYCYNKTVIEYDRDEDGEWSDPAFCPFCGIKEDDLDIYETHHEDHYQEFDEDGEIDP